MREAGLARSTAGASTPPSDASDSPSDTPGPPSLTAGPAALRTVLDRLAAAYGPQEWWPARDPFEMMAGALLTQRTTWRNAARALAALRRAGALAPEALAGLPTADLEALVRPAGTFRMKAARLQSMARWYIDSGGWEVPGSALDSGSACGPPRALRHRSGDRRRHSRLRLRTTGLRRRRLRAAHPVALRLGRRG